MMKGCLVLGSLRNPQIYTGVQDDIIDCNQINGNIVAICSRSLIRLTLILLDMS